MASVTIKHATLTGAAANSAALVDGPKWDASHTVTGLENVPNIDTTNADNISSGTMSAARLPQPSKRGLVSGWVPIGIRPLIVQSGYGPGGVTLSHTPFQYMTGRRRSWTSPAIVYAAPGAAGAGTRFDPCSITTAVSTSTAQIVRCYGGTYPTFTASYLDAAHGSGVIPKLIFGDSDVIFRQAGPEIAIATWTLDTANVYKTGALAVSGSQVPLRVYRIDNYDTEFGQPTRLKQFADRATLVAATTTEGWAYDSGLNVMYVRMSDLVGGFQNVNTFKSQLAAMWTGTSGSGCQIVGTGLPLGFFGPMNFEGVQVIAQNDGVNTCELYMDGLVGKINMRFPPDAGVQAFGGYSFVKNVRVVAAQDDSFNWNAGHTTGANGYVIAQDCESLSAGDVQTYGGSPRAPNLNGDSAHDNVQILRCGGFYAGGFGPVIADVGPGVSWNIRNIVRDTEDSQSLGYDFETGRVAFLDQCFSSGMTTSIQTVGATTKQYQGAYDGLTNGVSIYNPVTGF